MLSATHESCPTELYFDFDCDTLSRPRCVSAGWDAGAKEVPAKIFPFFNAYDRMLPVSEDTFDPLNQVIEEDFSGILDEVLAAISEMDENEKAGLTQAELWDRVAERSSREAAPDCFTPYAGLIILVSVLLTWITGESLYLLVLGSIFVTDQVIWRTSSAQG